MNCIKTAQCEAQAGYIRKQEHVSSGAIYIYTHTIRKGRVTHSCTGGRGFEGGRRRGRGVEGVEGGRRREEGCGT